MTGVADILLDLPFLPTRRRIAELGLEYIVVRHGEEADVDFTGLSAANTIDRRLHIVVDAPFRHAAEDPERVPVGIEQHLMGLQRIGAQEKGPTVRQLDMGDLKLRALTADNREVLAPVELERFTSTKGQRNERPSTRRCCSRCRSARHSRAKAATRL